MTAISKAMTFFDVVSGPTTPIAHFAIVFAPSMNSVIMNSDLSPMPSFAFEVRGLVHVAVNVAMDTGNGIGSSQAFRTLVHSKSFHLKGLFEDSNVLRDLNGL